MIDLSFVYIIIGYLLLYSSYDMLHFHMYVLSVFEINAVKRLRFYCCFLQHYAMLYWIDTFCGLFVAVVLLFYIQVQSYCCVYADL